MSTDEPVSSADELRAEKLAAIKEKLSQGDPDRLESIAVFLESIDCGLFAADVRAAAEQLVLLRSQQTDSKGDRDKPLGLTDIARFCRRLEATRCPSEARGSGLGSHDKPRFMKGSTVDVYIKQRETALDALYAFFTTADHLQSLAAPGGRRDS